MKPAGYLLIEGDAPAEPVSLVEAKKQLKMEGFDEDDAYLALLITAMREKCEEYCHASFVEQSWQLNFTEWPCDRLLELHRPPVATVESVQYLPSGEVEYVDLDASNYTFDATILPGVIRLTRGGLPTANCNYAAPIRVVINCGVYELFPNRVKLAMLMFLSTAYEVRPSLITGTIAMEVPDGAKSLLDSLKIWKL